MKALSILFSLASMLIFTMLLISSLSVGALGYISTSRDKILTGLEYGFVEDMYSYSSKINDYEYFTLSNMKIACSFGLDNVLNYYKQGENNGIFEKSFIREEGGEICAYIKTGRIRNDEELIKTTFKLYFKKNIEPGLNKLFEKTGNYLFLSIIVMLFLFITETLISIKSNRKALLFSITAGTITTLLLIYLTPSIIEDSVNKNVNKEMLEKFPILINIMKLYLREMITYSAIFSIIITNISLLLGIKIQEKNEEVSNKQDKKNSGKKKK